MTTLEDVNKAYGVIRNFLNEDAGRSITFWCRADEVTFKSSRSYGVTISDSKQHRSVRMNFTQAMEYIRTVGGIIRPKCSFRWIKYTFSDDNFWYCDSEGIITTTHGVKEKVQFTGSLLDCVEWEYVGNGAD